MPARFQLTQSFSQPRPLFLRHPMIDSKMGVWGLFCTRSCGGRYPNDGNAEVAIAARGSGSQPVREHMLVHAVPTPRAATLE